MSSWGKKILFLFEIIEPYSNFLCYQDFVKTFNVYTALKLLADVLISTAENILYFIYSGVFKTPEMVLKFSALLAGFFSCFLTFLPFWL